MRQWRLCSPVGMTPLIPAIDRPKQARKPLDQVPLDAAMRLDGSFGAGRVVAVHVKFQRILDIKHPFQADCHCALFLFEPYINFFLETADD